MASGNAKVQSSDQVTGVRTLLGISTPWGPSSWL